MSAIDPQKALIDPRTQKCYRPALELLITNFSKFARLVNKSANEELWISIYFESIDE
jgi:hypothetical protein